MEHEYYTIKQAAIALGVSTLTLRNWDRQEKLIAYRHPLNNYRMYKQEQIDEVIKKLGIRRDMPKKISVSLIEETETEIN